MSTDIRMFVKPAKGVKVRDPERGNQHLPKDGAYVPRNAYWLRRVKDNSVEETKAPKTTNSTSNK